MDKTQNSIPEKILSYMSNWWLLLLVILCVWIIFSYLPANPVKDSMLYTLSAISQTIAALVAISAFAVVYRIDSVLKHKEELSKNLNEFMAFNLEDKAAKNKMTGDLSKDILDLMNHIQQIQRFAATPTILSILTIIFALFLLYSTDIVYSVQGVSLSLFTLVLAMSVVSGLLIGLVLYMSLGLSIHKPKQ